jgi:hypothetical protein
MARQARPCHTRMTTTGHVGDQEFLAAWPTHPDFRMLK